MAQTRKSPKESGPGRQKKPRPGRGETGRSDRWPSDYGHRQQQEKEDRPLSSGRMKKKSAKALANVENRSRASAVVLSLHVARHTVTLSIQDDGVERDSRTIGPIASSATHVGLGRVGQRVQRVGGTFVAQLAHDGGFRVRVRLPLKATAAR